MLSILRVAIPFAVVASLFPISRASGAVDDDPARADQESHCVTFVIGQRPDGELILSDADCFDTEATAAFWATIPSPARLSGGLWTMSSAPGALSASAFTLGRHYDGFNGTGSSISVVGSSCIGGYWNTSSAWDNRISSSYNGCNQLKHWDLPYKSGIVESTFGSGTTDNLSFMNNRTESVSYH